MSEQPNLTVHEQRVADEYRSSGKLPEDPHDARILDYLFTSGQVEEIAQGDDAETATPPEGEGSEPGGSVAGDSTETV